MIIESISLIIVSSWMLLILFFLYENMKFKAAVKLWKMGKPEEAEKYCPAIADYMEELGDDC